MKIERVHFYTRNAAKTRDWLVDRIGFKAISRNSNRHTCTEVVALNSACFVLSSPLNSNSPVASYLDCHPSGVADVAFRVENLQRIIDRAQDLGRVSEPITTYHSDHGKFKLAKIAGWNGLQHTLIEVIAGEFSYCLEDLDLQTIANHLDRSDFNSHITTIDHIVLNVGADKLKPAVKLYQQLFGLQVQQSFNIQTEQSGLLSQALIDRDRNLQFNINEPTSANSQIQDFLDRNQGSGIQHLALRSQNLIADLTQMQHQLDFLSVPDTYYAQLKPTVCLSTAELAEIAKLQILVDCGLDNDRSLLMQIFTKPIFEQPTFFLEFIERRQEAQGFGQGNFKALFQAIESQQTADETVVN